MKLLKTVLTVALIASAVLFLAACNIKDPDDLLGALDSIYDGISAGTTPVGSPEQTDPPATEVPPYENEDGNIDMDDGRDDDFDIDIDLDGRPDRPQTNAPAIGDDGRLPTLPETDPPVTNAPSMILPGVNPPIFNDPNDSFLIPSEPSLKPTETTPAITSPTQTTPNVTTPAVTTPAQTTPAPHVHSWIEYDAKPATCTEDGWDAYKVCSSCGESTFKLIGAKKHMPVKDPAVAATCQKPGLTEGSHCLTCGEVLVPQTPVTVPHSFADGKCTACGEEKASEGLEYVPFGEGYRVVGIGTCTDKYVIIPSTHLGLPVVSIGQRAFANTDITGVKVPASVRSIEIYAFRFCYSLELLELSEGLDSIAAVAFGNCTALKNVVIPKSVTSIGGGILENCSAIESLTVPFVGESADGKIVHLSYLFGANKPEYTTEFKNCILNLKKITVTGGTKLGYRAFYQFKQVEEIVLPETLMQIDEAAFYMCSELRSIKLPKNVKSVGEDAFYACEKLSSVDLGGVTDIGENAFERCTALTELLIEDPEIKLGYDAFKSSGIKKIFFGGTAEYWQTAAAVAEVPYDATVYFYAETKPENGNAWHYVNGTPTVW